LLQTSWRPSSGRKAAAEVANPTIGL